MSPETVNDPYANKLVATDFYFQKTVLHGQMVVVLQGELDNRGLMIIKQPSRVVRQYEVIEMIMTDEESVELGGIVNKIAYIGFFEMLTGGVLLVGDSVTLNGEPIGQICGFDETHYPNHLNVVIRHLSRSSGRKLDAQLGHRVYFSGRAV